MSLARALMNTSDGPPGRVAYGTATGRNTVAIEGDATPVVLPALSSVTTGDYCAIWISATDALILGKVGAEVTVSGSPALTLDASGIGTITFGVTFAVAPTVVLTMRLDSGLQRTAHLMTNSTTSCNVRCFVGAAQEGAVTRSVHFIAIGTLA